VIPTQSRFNRRRGLMPAFNLIRRVLLECLDAAQDRQCVMDSLPLPVVQFHLVPSSPATSTWRANASTHTLCIYIKRLLGKPAFLQIKALAFPIQHKTLVEKSSSLFASLKV
jgi:hypothetical protein